MPLQLGAPIVKEFILALSDEAYGNTGDPTTVTIKQATQGEHAQREAIFTDVTQFFSARAQQLEEVPNDVRVIQHWSMSDLARKEAYLTMVGCTILDTNGTPLFHCPDGRLKMSEAAFNNAWAKLPPLVANEIHEKVLDVNISWRGQSG